MRHANRHTHDAYRQLHDADRQPHNADRQTHHGERQTPSGHRAARHDDPYACNAHRAGSRYYRTVRVDDRNEPVAQRRARVSDFSLVTGRGAARTRNNSTPVVDEYGPIDDCSLAHAHHAIAITHFSLYTHNDHTFATSRSSAASRGSKGTSSSSLGLTNNSVLLGHRHGRTRWRFFSSALFTAVQR